MRPLWLVVLLATILPGGGQMGLGRTRAGLILLGAALFLLLPLSAAALLQWGQLQWLCLRALTTIYLFGVVDAALLHVELSQDRDGSGPRAAGLANLLLYGLGYGLLGSWPLAVAGGLAGLIVHGLLGATHLAWLLVGELLAAGLAVHAFLAAVEADAMARPARGRGIPGWLGVSLASFVGIHLLLLAFSSYAGKQLEAAIRIDQSGAVATEPYYTNDLYGVRVELNAPGWSFVDAASDEYLRARHVSGDAEFSLRSAPRLFGFPDAATMARTVLGEGLLEGISLSVVDEGPVRVAGLGGWHIRARGQQAGQPREVEIVAAGKGWRNYVLWYEWGDENRNFATQELEYLLGHVDLAGHRPADAPNLAR